MEKACIFGASQGGKHAHESLKDIYDIKCFIDNSPQKQGSTMEGLPVLSLEKALHNRDHKIIICSQYVDEIIKQLISHGINQFSVYDVLKTNSTERNIAKRVVDCNFENGLTLQEDKIALYIENSSGSNTCALSCFNQDIPEYTILPLYNMEATGEKYLARLTSKNLIVTHEIVTDAERNYFQLWHGFPLKGLNFMSRSKSPKYQLLNHNYWLNYRSIASYSATYTTLMNACYGVPINKYTITGMPRNDFLYHSHGDAIFEQVTGIKKGAQKIICYMPTYRKTGPGQVNGRINTTIFDFPDFDAQELDNFLISNNLLLLVKMHPFQTKDVIKLKEQLGIQNIVVITDEMLFKHKRDIYEIINAVDLLITDYSSIYFDYLLLDRPIIFSPLDLDDYGATRGFLVEPYEFWAPGAKCFYMQSLLSTIDAELEKPDRYHKERERVTSMVHHYRDGNSSQRVWEMVKQVLF